jgi:hypothetical protein
MFSPGACLIGKKTKASGQRELLAHVTRTPLSIRFNRPWPKRIMFLAPSLALLPYLQATCQPELPVRGLIDDFLYSLRTEFVRCSHCTHQNDFDASERISPISPLRR